MNDGELDLKAACEEVLMNCAVNNLRKLTRRTTSSYNERIKSTGMKTTQMCVLLAIGQEQGKPMNFYADVLSMDLSTLARGVETLARDGYIKTKSGRRRERLLFLTDEAVQKIKDVYPLWKGVQSEFVESFGQEQWQAYLDAAQKTAA